MIGAPNLKWVTQQWPRPFRGGVPLSARHRYDQHIYQMWSLYLCMLPRHERLCKMKTMRW